MKKVIMLFVVMLLIFGVTGCNKNIQEPENLVAQPEVESNAEIIASSEISSDILELNKISSFKGDIDGDGTDEEISLVTSAECDDNGEFIWNDGQNWALYVDDEEDYLLFEQYLNAGYPYFEVSEYYMKDGAEPKVNLIISTGAGFSVINFEFSKADNGYVKSVIYDTAKITQGGINRRFSSFPEYSTKD